MTVRLEIDYVGRPAPFLADPAEELFLDRDFLSAGADLSVSRAPNTPSLRCMGGDWWLLGHGGATAGTTLHIPAERRHYRVAGDRLAFLLPEGESEVSVWTRPYRIGLLVSGSAQLTGPAPPAPPGDVTVSAQSAAKARVGRLLRDRQRHRIVLIAWCRNHFVVRNSAVRPPVPRQEVLDCLGLRTDTALEAALDDVSKAIWGETSGHRTEIADFLVDNGLITGADQDLLPHNACTHRVRPAT